MQFGYNFCPRSGPVHWLTWSWKLIPGNYFLLGYVKLLVYADKPATLEALEVIVLDTIDNIRPDLLENIA